MRVNAPAHRSLVQGDFPTNDFLHDTFAEILETCRNEIENFIKFYYEKRVSTCLVRSSPLTRPFPAAMFREMRVPAIYITSL